MQLFILDHNYAFVDEPSTPLKNLLSYSTKTYNRRFKTWKYDKHSLIDQDNCFLTGLAPYVADKLKIDFTDRRSFPNTEIRLPKLKQELREYQIDYAIQALKLNRCIIESTTGSGKTLMLAALMSILNLPTLIIAPDKTVEAQLKTELSNLLIDPPLYTIGIARNLFNLPDITLKSFPVVLVDEAHRCAASQAEQVILRTHAPFRFGFTGTATGRSDNRDLVVQGLLGPIIRLVEPEELVQQGFLAETSSTFVYGSWDGDYAVLEDLLIVKNPKRNQLIANIVKHNKNKTILILVRRIDHGEILHGMLSKSRFIHGDTSAEEREHIREEVKRESFRVLIASNIFATGLDIPSLEVGINAAGGKAEIITAQKLGRVMRPWHDLCKKWYDIYDRYHPILETHSKERYKTYIKSGVKIELIGFPSGIQNSLERETYDQTTESL